ncbi:hypothetical protein BDQ17DRAFT_1332459 [Cyathus striatus]|nr:hypothetical protein BDQ17DRAFT_1332459 [Cyathus striatus]
MEELVQDCLIYMREDVQVDLYGESGGRFGEMLLDPVVHSTGCKIPYCILLGAKFKLVIMGLVQLVDGCEHGRTGTAIPPSTLIEHFGKRMVVRLLLELVTSDDFGGWGGWEVGKVLGGRKGACGARGECKCELLGSCGVVGWFEMALIQSENYRLGICIRSWFLVGVRGAKSTTTSTVKIGQRAFGAGKLKNGIFAWCNAGVRGRMEDVVMKKRWKGVTKMKDVPGSDVVMFPYKDEILKQQAMAGFLRKKSKQHPPSGGTLKKSPPAPAAAPSTAPPPLFARFTSNASGSGSGDAGGGGGRAVVSGPMALSSGCTRESWSPVFLSSSPPQPQQRPPSAQGYSNQQHSSSSNYARPPSSQGYTSRPASTGYPHRAPSVNGYIQPHHPSQSQQQLQLQQQQQQQQQQNYQRPPSSQGHVSQRPAVPGQQVGYPRPPSSQSHSSPLPSSPPLANFGGSPPLTQARPPPTPAKGGAAGRPPSILRDPNPPPNLSLFESSKGGGSVVRKGSQSQIQLQQQQQQQQQMQGGRGGPPSAFVSQQRLPQGQQQFQYGQQQQQQQQVYQPQSQQLGRPGPRPISQGPLPLPPQGQRPTSQVYTHQGQGQGQRPETQYFETEAGVVLPDEVALFQTRTALLFNQRQPTFTFTLRYVYVMPSMLSYNFPPAPRHPLASDTGRQPTPFSQFTAPCLPPSIF